MSCLCPGFHLWSGQLHGDWGRGLHCTLNHLVVEMPLYPHRSANIYVNLYHDEKILSTVMFIYYTFLVALTGDLQEGIEENPLEQEDNVQDMLKLDPGRIKSITFPKYVDPHVKDDMVSCLGRDSSQANIALF